VRRGGEEGKRKTDIKWMRGEREERSQWMRTEQVVSWASVALCVN
jgi:hypothetical protein